MIDNITCWNKAKFTSCTQVNAQTAKIEANRGRYDVVSKATGVPWDVIGVIHPMHGR